MDLNKNEWDYIRCDLGERRPELGFEHATDMSYHEVFIHFSSTAMDFDGVSDYDRKR